MPIPLWILERFHDFGKLCPFCEEATPGADVRQEQRRRRLPTLLRRLLFSSRKMEEERAAALIQRNYRGYRERRQLSGLHLSASDRWKEALKELQYQKQTRPSSKKTRSSDSASRARENWRRVAAVTRRAGADDSSCESDPEGSMDPKELEEYRKNKLAARKERHETAKVMNLEYFLEMVDVKHRYGSNLRTYHQEWMKSDASNENFFYWLDHGKGRNLDLPVVSRQRLDSERVRYLSREERQNYLVKVDEEGRLCWAKSGQRISTTPLFKDTLDGIVPLNDAEHQAWTVGQRHRGRSSSISSSSSSSTMPSTGSAADNFESQHYVNQELTQAQGWKKLKYVSATTILNQLLQKSVKPNSWIFVADTSFRLYVGIKQSGAFQHSSFLHGARVSAAGLIKIKDGQLRRLSPLSGHYRPPTKNFRLFVHSLKDEGVDMSRVSISRAYAVLVGLETYVRTRKKIKHGLQHTMEGGQRLIHPEEVEQKRQAALDQSMSARRERQILSAQAAREEQEKESLGLFGRMLRRLKSKPKENKDSKDLGKPSPSQDTSTKSLTTPPLDSLKQDKQDRFDETTTPPEHGL